MPPRAPQLEPSSWNGFWGLVCVCVCAIVIIIIIIIISIIISTSFWGEGG